MLRATEELSSESQAVKMSKLMGEERGFGPFDPIDAVESDGALYDVPNGALSINGTTWTHRRHGSGVLFVSSSSSRVNAHIAMAEHPEGIDSGRLVEYFESLGLDSATFNGYEYKVDKRVIDTMLADMALRGLLRTVVTQERFPHRIFELACGVADSHKGCFPRS